MHLSMTKSQVTLTLLFETMALATAKMVPTIDHKAIFKAVDHPHASLNVSGCDSEHATHRMLRVQGTGFASGASTLETLQNH